jgi:hypothetical protein
VANRNSGRIPARSSLDRSNGCVVATIVVVRLLAIGDHQLLRTSGSFLTLSKIIAVSCMTC